MYPEKGPSVAKPSKNARRVATWTVLRAASTSPAENVSGASTESRIPGTGTDGDIATPPEEDGYRHPAQAKPDKEGTPPGRPLTEKGEEKDTQHGAGLLNKEHQALGSVYVDPANGEAVENCRQQVHAPEADSPQSRLAGDCHHQGCNGIAAQLLVSEEFANDPQFMTDGSLFPGLRPSAPVRASERRIQTTRSAGKAPTR